MDLYRRLEIETLVSVESCVSIILIGYHNLLNLVLEFYKFQVLLQLKPKGWFYGTLGTPLDLPLQSI